MSDPIVTPDDLGIYLGTPILPGTVAWDRASQLIEWAQALCETIVAPLPRAAAPVVLDVIQRAYSNPLNVTQQATGPFSASYGGVRGGMWLTNANKAALRALSGRSGVFEISMTDVTIPGPIPFSDWDNQPL